MVDVTKWGIEAFIFGASFISTALYFLSILVMNTLRNFKLTRQENLRLLPWRERLLNISFGLGMLLVEVGLQFGFWMDNEDWRMSNSDMLTFICVKIIAMWCYMIALCASTSYRYMLHLPYGIFLGAQISIVTEMILRDEVNFVLVCMVFFELIALVMTFVLPSHFMVNQLNILYDRPKMDQIAMESHDVEVEDDLVKNAPFRNNFGQEDEFDFED